MKATLTLYLGRYVPTPVSGQVAEAIESVQVRQNLTSRSTFQIVLRADRTLAAGDDYALLAGVASPIAPTVRVIVEVTVDGTSTILIDGYVLHQSLDPGAGPTKSGTITLTGEDVSVKMDLTEHSREFPAMPDSAIVAYLVMHYPEVGLVPLVIPPEIIDPPDPLETIPMQQGTDYQHLTMLADKYGYTFRVEPGPVVGTNTAYWGPLLHTALSSPQPALTVGGGIGTNVEQINFSYDAMQAHTIKGETLDEDTGEYIPLVTALIPSDPYASRPPAIIQQAFYRSIYQSQGTGGDSVRAYGYAFGQVLRSQQTVVRAEGRLDALRYGRMLSAFGNVGVRGAGESYDGVYYVESATHTVAGDRWTTDFTLTRGGMGSTLSSIPA